jgi:pimeloyl-ACP methyl ester carboxylesterase
VPTFRVDGLTLHYDLRGRGHPVVLLHGFTSRGSTWERHGWLDLLGEAGLRPIAPDARSHGRSDRVLDAASCSTKVLAADVAALLDKLEIPQASLVGFSMGGGTALQLAMDRPERVTRIAVAGVGDAAINELHDPAEIAELATVFAADPADVPAGTSAARIRQNAELAGNDPRALLPFLEQGGWPGGLRELSPVEAPTLVTVSDDDEYMPGARALLEWLAPTTVVRLRGKSHYELLPDETVKRQVVEFLTEPDR